MTSPNAAAVEGVERNSTLAHYSREALQGQREHIEKLEAALRDIRNLHTPVGDESAPGSVHRAVIVGICDAALAKAGACP